MNWKRLAAATAILIVIAAAFWSYLVVTYESELGTSNVVQVDLTDSVSDSSSDNQLVSLDFSDDAEDLSWSSLEISIIVDQEIYGCSFGSQSNSEMEDSKVVPRLGADGQTFTTEVDATDSESYTFFDVAQQFESNESDYWMKFSSTDIYLDSDVTWAFVEGAYFSEVQTVPEEMSNLTEDRLEWYEYDMAVHRVNPSDGVYIFAKDEMSFKIKFLTYYNEDDESRYPTMQIASVGNTSFPALDNPDLVVPSPCKIITDDFDTDFWNANETIHLIENGGNICDGVCEIELAIKYETINVEIELSKFEIGQ
tara:strand:+ start:4359 stop:5288 length:930 start_codon:yes stop_codon:yes gene_type:complete